MATFFPFHHFVEDLAHGLHNLSTAQLTVALTAAANAPDSAANEQLSHLTQISYTNLSSRNITTSSSTQTTGTYRLVLSDLTLTASGAVATFRYVVIYNNTSTNDRLMGFYDYGTNVTMANGDTFVIDFDGVNGLFALGLA